MGFQYLVALAPRLWLARIPTTRRFGLAAVAAVLAVLLLTVPDPAASQNASSDATLSQLQVFKTDLTGPDAGEVVHPTGSAYTLTPAFDPSVTEYALRIPDYGQAGHAEQVTVVTTASAAAPVTFWVTGERVLGETRTPKRRPLRPDTHANGDEGNGPWASGPWRSDFPGYTWIDTKVTAPDGKTVKTYTVKVEYGTVSDPRDARVTPGDGELTLTWKHPASGKADNYFARWRKAGTTEWLNPADRERIFKSAVTGAAGGAWAWSDSTSALSYTITGLENGVEYEVELQALLGGGNNIHRSVPDDRKDDWITSGWVSASGTPGKTVLTITPTSPTREYGGTDDLSYTVSGVESGDAGASVVSGALARAVGNDAGSYAFDLSGLTIATAYAGKYTLPSAPSVANYTITAKPITAVSGVVVNSRAADGATTATFDTSNADGTGVLAAELADFRAGGLQVTGSFASASPGTHDVSVTYSLQDQGSFKAGNYTLSATGDTLQGEITTNAAECACQFGLMLFADGVPAEGGGPVTVVVGLKDPAGSNGVSVTLTTGGTATGDDYTLSSATVSIAEGATAGTATITVTDDAVDDDGETIILNASAGAASLSAAPLTLTITDNDDASTPTSTHTPTPTPPAAGTDYDTDDDGLIEVSSLARLNAIRWDPDGDGSASDAGYAAAFPNPAAGMGCPATGCKGYELTADLDFDTNGNGEADAGDAYWNASRGWTPIDFGANDAETVFEGNGHTISNLYTHLYVRRTIDGISLFGTVSAHGVIRNLGMVSVDNVSSHNPYVAGLAGIMYGTIQNSYATGKVSGQNSVGGLVGALRAPGRIIGSYTAVTTTGRTDDVGGLVGATEGGTIIASYATGNVSGQGDDIGGLIGEGSTSDRTVASYATGDVSGRDAVGGLVGHASGAIVSSFATGDASGRADVGGLAGYASGTVRASYSTGAATGRRDVGGLIGDGYHIVTTSYWDLDASGNARSSDGDGKSTKDLKRPTGYEGIYATWNLDLDGDGAADDPWDFGSWCEYPALKYGGLSPDAQRALCKPTDYDTDDDGLIEVSTLAQLDVVRWDLDGDGYPGHSYSGVESYAAAFLGAPPGAMGCPDNRCVGYELVADLDFDTNGNGRADAGDAYWNGGSGWTPIAYMVPPEGFSKYSFGAVFEGNGHTIRNLFIDTENQGAGLFDILTARPNGVIRNLRLESVNVSGKENVGGLVGENQGTISGVSVSGNVSGRNAVGGLVGENQGTVIGSRSTASVTGDSPRSAEGRDVGGLVGRNEGKLRTSYATGQVSGKANNTGGLVGFNSEGSNIISSYASGDVSSSGHYIGGLVGSHWGAITASYAGGSAGGSGSGGLVGYHGGTVTASYWDTDQSQAATVGISDAKASGPAGEGKTTAELQSPTGYAGIYAGWNVDVDGDGNADDPWDFGASSQYPLLKGVGQQHPPAVEPEPGQPQQTARTFSVTDTASAAEGEAASLTVTLSEAAPAGGVSFTLTAGYGSTATSGDVGIITSPVTVLEGNTTLDISAPTVDDDIDEDDETFTVTVATAAEGWEKEGDGKDTATVTITDDDTAGVTVTPTTLDIGEDGSATYTVVLDSQPTADVTLTATSSDDGAASVSPASYTFTPSGWNTAQTFTVSGVSDEDTDDERVAIRHQAASQDVSYGGIIVNSVAVSMEDNTPEPEKQVEEPQQTARTFSVTATASATEGSDAMMTVTLSEAAPAGGVSFTLTAGYGSTATSGDVGIITSPVTVLEGNTTLDISAPTVDDDIDEDDETFTVTVATAAEGWEKEGDGKDAATVTITDDDTAGVTVTPTTLDIGEDGSATYTVVLDSQPTADVTVTAASGDVGAVSVSPASYTFTPENWDTAQAFTVSGVGDDDQDDESVSVGHSVTGGDGKYGGIAVEPVAVAVSDTTPAPPEPEDPKDSWRDYDTNGNGCIDPDEYLEAVYDYAAARISTAIVMSVVKNRCE